MIEQPINEADFDRLLGSARLIASDVLVLRTERLSVWELGGGVTIGMEHSANGEWSYWFRDVSR